MRSDTAPHDMVPCCSAVCAVVAVRSAPSQLRAPGSRIGGTDVSGTGHVDATRKKVMRTPDIIRDQDRSKCVSFASDSDGALRTAGRTTDTHDKDLIASNEYDKRERMEG